MASSTVENYLKQLYLEQQTAPEQVVPMGRIASLMGVVPGTATSMVKALADAGLVNYEPRGGVMLTRAGEQLALHVLRRHRLVELFLVKVLGLDWSEVHDEAEVLERMDALLERPSVDPHGDPIPTARGKVSDVGTHSLADCEVRRAMRIVRVVDQEADFLQFVSRRRLTPGATVTVDEREPAAGAVTIKSPGGRVVTLGLAAAEKIIVEPA